MKLYFSTSLGKLYCGDALEVMKNLPDESVDLVVTDPPYGSRAIEWDKKNMEFQRKWLEEVHRVMKEGASIYVFFAPLKLREILEIFEGLYTLKNILVWWHRNLYGAGMSYGKDRWKSTWDVILYGVKGERAKHGKKIQEYAYIKYGNSFDVMEYPQPRPLLHKAQKPLRLMEKIIDCSSNRHDVVLDPFAGSGTMLVAAERLERRWIGIEIEEEFCEIIKKRFEDIRRGVRLV